jgi:tetratricopeptide (TPR) repeat protein
VVAMLCARAVEVPTRWPASMDAIPEESLVKRYLETGLSVAGDAKNEAKIRLLLGKAFWPFAFRLFSEEADAAGRIAGDEARALARELGRPDLECAAFDALSSIDFVRGYHGRLIPEIAARIEVAKTLIDPWEIGDAYQVAADNALTVGNYRAALEFAREGYERASGGPVAGACLAWRALARFRLGDWDGMSGDMDKLEVAMEAIAYWFFGVTAAGAAMHQLRGNESQSRRLLDRVNLAPGKQSLSRAVANVSRVLARQGDGGAAWALLDATWDNRTMHSAILESECDVVAITEAWERAPDTVARARANAEEAQVLALPLFADRLEGRAALAAGDAAGAIDALTRARDGFGSLGARWDQAASSLALGEALIAKGARDAGTRELQAALDVFDELGSVREIARARDLLNG